MRAITHCPSCQTEFFVNDDQLAQHQGKVRCGECLHVFNAKEQLITLQSATDIPDSVTFNSSYSRDSQHTAIENVTTFSNTKSYPQDQPYNTDITEVSTPIHQASRKRRLPARIAAFSLGILALAQTIYYARHEIALYYPNLKPALTHACQILACTIDLPKKIDLIVIDDSDLHEDETYTGLIRLTSTLVNQADFNQAYPNLDITLTDTEDKPKLRRIFKPSDYLPADINISNGIAAKLPLNITLNITTKDAAVAGYRVAVSY